MQHEKDREQSGSVKDRAAGSGTRGRLGASLRLVGGAVFLAWLGETLLVQARGGGSWAGVAGGLLVAGSVLALGLVARHRRALWESLGTVETASTVLAAFAAVCVAASLVLQASDLEARGLKGEQAYQAFREAEASFVLSLLRPRRGGGGGDPAESDKLLAAFGPELGAARAKDARKGREIERQQVQGKEFAERHDAWFRALYRFCGATGLSDTYRSGWFATLMFLLVASLMAGTAKHTRRRTKGSFLVTHVGFVLLVAGFGLSRWTSRRLYLPMRVGQWSEAALGPDGEEVKLPFRVTLAEFATEYRKRLVAALEGEETLQAKLETRIGSRFALDGGKYRVEVLEHLARARAEARIVNRSDAPFKPAVRIDLQRGAGPGPSGWLFTDPPEQAVLHDAESGVLVTFHRYEDLELGPMAPDAWGSLRLSSEGATEADEPVMAGRKFEYAGRSFEVRSVVRDFASRGMELGEQPVRNPAVELLVAKAGEEPKKRWVFAWLDFDRLHPPPHPEVRIRYRYSDPRIAPDRVIRLVARPEGIEVVRTGSDGRSTLQPIDVGAVLASLDGGGAVRLEQFVPRAEWETVVAPQVSAPAQVPVLPPAPPRQPAGSGSSRATGGGHGGAHGPGDGHDHGHAEGHGHGSGDGHAHEPETRDALRVRVTVGTKAEERWLIADEPELGTWSDGRLTVVYGSDANDVAEWRSTVTVASGGESRTRVVKVNHPMDFMGWTFYQSDARAEEPDFSGLRLVYDPGWPLVALGLLFSCLGVAWAFWIDPLRAGEARSEGGES